jgi:hypothetical protein
MYSSENNSCTFFAKLASVLKNINFTQYFLGFYIYKNLRRYLNKKKKNEYYKKQEESMEKEKNY